MESFTRKTQINVGGQGEVWRCETPDGREIAAKYLLAQGTAEQQEEARKRFVREVNCQSSLKHENIMPVLSVHVDDKTPHFTMPIAESSLRDRLKASSGGLPEDEVVAILSAVLDAITYAHSEGVVHRDLKPENILFVNGIPMVADFGLGRRMYSDSTTLTVTNAAMGTVAYSAPEQFVDVHAADERADVFAIGRILYEMLCGEFAFLGTHVDRIPSRFRYIVVTATQQEPGRRFPSVASLAREIALLDRGSEVLLPPAERCKTLFEQIASGDRAQVPELVKLLLENSDDSQLYLRVLTGAPAPALDIVAFQDPDGFKRILEAFDKFAEGSHPWSFTDTLARFLQAVYRATADMEVRTRVIERLHVLGYEHNRWFVRSVFLEVVEDALKDQSYAQAIAAIIRDHPEGREFVVGPLRELSLPLVVAEALAA